MRRLLYIIGIPGAGKTTILRAALAGLPRQVVADSRPPYITYPGGAQLGVDRGLYSGTDGYALNVQPQALAWLYDSPFENVVAEGDRLANDGFFQGALDLRYELRIAWIDTPEDTAAQRRWARGSKQDEAWLRGRCTKVRRLAARWADRLDRIDGRKTVAAAADDLLMLPTIASLTGETLYTSGPGQHKTEV